MFILKRIMPSLIHLSLCSLLLFSCTPTSVTHAAAKSMFTIQQETYGKDEYKQGTTSFPLRDHTSIMQVVKSAQQKEQDWQSNTDLKVVQQQKDTSGKQHLLIQQTYKGIPIYDRYVQFNLDSTAQSYTMQDHVDSTIPLAGMDTTPAWPGSQAVAILKSNIEYTLGQSIDVNETGSIAKSIPPTAQLLIYDVNGTMTLTYRVELHYMKPVPARWIGYIDAHTGKVIDKYNELSEIDKAATGIGYGYDGIKKTINITYSTDLNVYTLYDRTHTAPIWTSSYMYDRVQLGGGNYVVPTSSNSTTFKDSTSSNYYRAATDAHYNAGFVYDFYAKEFNRKSIDNKDMSVLSIVNYPEAINPNGTVVPMDNAFWSGSAMYYGDGSGTSRGGFNCMSCALDVVGHELTHGVTQYTANLEYRYQQGALNESFSDIMAAVMDRNWTIGESTGRIIRNMENPNAYNQPSKMSEYYDWALSRDNGGVHYNSGIPNHAAYLIATAIDAQKVGVDGRKIVGQLAYSALTKYLFSTAKFQDAANAFTLAVDDLTTLKASQRLLIKSIVIEGWKNVGVTPSVPTTTITDLSATSLSSTSVSLSWTMTNNNNKIVVEQSKDNGTTWAPASATISTPSTEGTAVVKKLSALTTYKFRLNVTAGSNVGYSNQAEVTVQMPQLLVTLAKTTDTSAELTWDSVISTSGVSLEKSTNNGTSWTTANATISTVTAKQTLTALSPMTAYKFRLKATFNGNTMTSNEVSLTTAQTTLQSFALTSRTLDAVSFSWTPPTGASSIKIVYSTDEGSTWKNTTGKALAVTAKTATITGCYPNSTYSFKLVVTGGTNAGESNEVNVTTMPAVLAPTTITHNSISLAWVNAAKLAVIVQQSSDGGTTWTTATTTKMAAAATSTTVTNLTADTTYLFRLVAASDSSTVLSDEREISTNAAPTTGFSLTSISFSTVNFGWTPPSALSSIRIDYSIDEGSSWSTVGGGAIPNATRAVSISNLTADTAYKFKLVATGLDRNTTESEVAFSTLTHVIAPTAITSSSVNLAWISTPKLPLTIEQSADDGTTWTTASTSKLTATSVNTTVINLNAQTTYKFRLVAGTGSLKSYSNEISVTTY